MTPAKLSPLIAAALVTVVGAAVPAHAQSIDYEALVRAMRACSAILDVGARVSCYDGTLGDHGSPSGHTPSVPVSPPLAEARGSSANAGFGAQDLRRPRTSAERVEPAELRIQVVSASQFQPGLYRLALQDGSAWEFVDAMPRAYDPPQKGASIVIRHGALGNFFLDYENQRSLRVRRVR